MGSEGYGTVCVSVFLCICMSAKKQCVKLDSGLQEVFRLCAMLSKDHTHNGANSCKNQGVYLC